MAELLLIARLAGRRIAFPAASVEAVVELEGITPAPGAAPHVAGLSALRSRVLTVIDGLAAIEHGRANHAAARDAIVVPFDGHTYALIVEEVEDVVEADGPCAPLAAPVGAGWDRVALGTVEAGDELFLLVDPHLLIAGPAAQAA
ncbi:MAG: purine-binding chemotaxis protein CheW [Sphingomonadales bacterium]|jgi:purine-binding chemotaxis protein CheW|nr:purine-binding chemotaxis protein CheW [Sphingomonadales bacterium]